MALLKIKTKREGYKLVGVQIPPQEYNYLALYTLAKGIPKTKIYKEVLYNWINSHEKKEPVDVLLQEIIFLLNTNYDKLAASEDNLITLSDYKEIVKAELEDKSVSDECINLILKAIQ